jgi:vanZ family protein
MKDFLKRHAKLLISLLLIFQMLFIFTMSSFGSDSSNAQSGQIIQVLRQVFPSLSHTSGPDTSVLTFIVRKTAHFTEYAILGILFYFFYRQILPQKNGLRLFVLAILSSFLYACTDEIHQLFVPGRSGQFTDVLVDTLGASFGCASLAFSNYLRRVLQARRRVQ